ncbi:HNH endonuclease signature motif containing protein [Paraburkholderia fungorum]|uniref:HNH endonuclease signature motif containing protein n=1 Tax=Paraburkholderia fungorum TaxID=134537 RepID=UPI0038BAAE9D
MNSFDSEVVQRLKAELDEFRNDSSDWGRSIRTRIQKRIRAQRVLEARARGTHTAEEWLCLVKEFDGRCVRCQCRPVNGPEKDHIEPIYQGGSDAIDNLQPSCARCNASKGPESFNWVAYRREHGFTEV